MRPENIDSKIIEQNNIKWNLIVSLVFNGNEPKLPWTTLNNERECGRTINMIMKIWSMIVLYQLFIMAQEGKT